MPNFDPVRDVSSEIRVEKYFTHDHEVFVVWLNGRRFVRRKDRNGLRSALWSTADRNAGDKPISPEIEGRLAQIYKYDKVLRFPRLKRQGKTPFDADNPMWENIPRFDPNEVDDTKWLIPSFLPEKGIHLVYGAHGSCKTTLMIYAAKCISEGSHFLGMKTLRRHFLVFDYDSPADFLKLRAIDLDLRLPENPRLIIWNRFKEPTPHPSKQWLKKFVRDHVKKYGVGPVIMFDSFSNVLKPGEGGETTGQIAPIYAYFRKLVDLGATVIVIDHTRRGDDELYGGADKKAKSDSSHCFIGPDKIGVVKVKSTLKRYSPERSDEFSFKVCGHQDEKGNWHITAIQSIEDARKEEEITKIEYISRLIKEMGQDGKEALLDRAAKEGHRRSEITKILGNEKRYWKMRREKSGKHVYRLLEDAGFQNPAPKGAGVLRN